MAHQRGSKKITRTRWFSTSNSFLGLAAGEAAINVRGDVAVAETWLRFRGRWTAWLDATPAAGDAVLVTMGLIVVSAGLGTTVLSSPFSQGDAAWLWWDQVLLAYDEISSNNPTYDIGSARGEIDNKAMRILRPDREV